MNSAEIRDRFRDFFVARGHLAGEPAGLVPAGDPSVLFTSAGMQQFKPYYLGVETPPATRMVTVQRCFRTNDIENVGRTARHLTFFEMLGNFSFGDYFKKEAIAWALEFSDELGIDRSRLWATVFGGDDVVPADDEAAALWTANGIPEERVVRLGRGDNFWGPVGPAGPCGPCSELYFDMGAEVGCGRPDCAPGCDCDRFMEYWNLVFPQYDMDEGGVLTPLPRPSIDTGMGLERVAAVTQGVVTVFETDLFAPLVERGAALAGVDPQGADATVRALRTMAEHARGAAFLVMDGVLPSNEGRGYVLRRIVRRAVQQGVSIGIDEPFAAILTDTVVDIMGEAYPQLVAQRDEIRRVVNDEEVRFRRTLEQGMGILEEALRRARDTGAELPAEVAFELHDTYGFPFDLTREIAAEADMTVDEARFERLMEEQRERARAAQKAGAFGAGPGALEDFQAAHADKPVEFVGYERLEIFTVVTAVGDIGDGRLAVKLAQSPFYAEGGGQVADQGWIHTESGKLEVEDVVRFVNDQVIVARPTEGEVHAGERAKAMVNSVRRHQTACNHTATHLLHNALRIVLGEDVRQAGSMVSPDKLRFDYSTRRSPIPEQLLQIEELVNRRIVENHPVRPFVTTREYAAELGALAFFEEKYGEFVRVLEIDDFSRELCGGTHVSSTSEIGLFKITASQSVGANTRRIEAITSARAIEYYRGLEHTYKGLAERLGVKPDRVAAAVDRLIGERDELQTKLKAVRSGAARDRLDEVLAGLVEIDGVPVVAARPQAEAADDLLTLADEIRARKPDAVALLATDVGGRAAIVVALGDAAVGRGLHAHEILKAMTPAVGGKGGGKPTLARGGGADVDGIPAALDAGVAKVRELLGA
ncbi:MAG TPA: alanine--tRNA ligase [Thermoleophilia bacterium]|nr:alanine--tRNA ligase [Thermoleophilia bacterium]HQG54649.1 alanine--tRNA ligase [Thermoleophilia bacterium]